MASINLDLNYFDHQKAMRLEARLGNGADVLPIRLWAYVGRQNPEHGRLAMLEAELERICRWWGDKGAMVAAMCEIGFLERDGDFFIIHDWFDHSGHLAQFKKRAQKAARKRWGVKRKSSNATSNAKAMSKQSPSRAVPYLPNKHNQHLTSPQRKGFQKPIPEEATAYAKTIGFKLDGEAFCAHYEARGWKYGPGRPMVSWQAAIVTWKKKAEPSALIKPPKPAEVLPGPEELVSHDDVKGLMSSLRGKEIPRV